MKPFKVYSLVVLWPLFEGKKSFNIGPWWGPIRSKGGKSYHKRDEPPWKQKIRFTCKNLQRMQKVLSSIETWQKYIKTQKEAHLNIG